MADVQMTSSAAFAPPTNVSEMLCAFNIRLRAPTRWWLCARSKACPEGAQLPLESTPPMIGIAQHSRSAAKPAPLRLT
jgi:hypothetical protein